MGPVGFASRDTGTSRRVVFKLDLLFRQRATPRMYHVMSQHLLLLFFGGGLPPRGRLPAVMSLLWDLFLPPKIERTHKCGDWSAWHMSATVRGSQHQSLVSPMPVVLSVRKGGYTNHTDRTFPCRVVSKACLGRARVSLRYPESPRCFGLPHRIFAGCSMTSLAGANPDKIPSQVTLTILDEARQPTGRAGRASGSKV